MNDKVILLITLGILIILMISLLKVIQGLKTPRYIKPKSFLKLYDDEKTLKNTYPIEIKHNYIKNTDDMFFKEGY